MPAYDIFFWGILFFLIGIAFASAGFSFHGIILITAFLAGTIFLASFLWVRAQKKLLLLIPLSLFIIAGSIYYFIDKHHFEDFQIIFEKKIDFSGVIVRPPKLFPAGGEIIVKLKEPFRGNILVKLPRYPEFHYGDEMNFSGVIKMPEPASYAAYLAKERINGVSFFPKVERVRSGAGGKIKTALFDLKQKMENSFRRFLPAKEAAFLAGLTLGDRDEFSSDFREAMKLSGTTHLVALSGYNITIIVWVVMAIFLSFLNRRLAFAITLIVICGFVLMTGAEASVVRAAIMGSLVLFAKEVGKIYSFRNAIVLAGFVMVLENPKVLVFDLGFQLSFLALIGIIYLKPAVQNFFRMSESPGFLSIKENFLTTLSAQLAVFPLLILNFGSFSPISILTNVIILEAIPVTMGLGFLIAAADTFSYYLALIFSWVAFVLLKFEIFVIEFFAKLSFPFNFNLNLPLAILYYGFIAFFSYNYGNFHLKNKKT